MEYLKNAFYGLLIGIANAIPGVSGGTMAVILDVYDKIMFSISRKNIKENLKFLIPLGIGAVAGIFALSKVILGAMESHPVILNFCFIGLVIGSMPALFHKTKDDEGKSFKILNVIFFLIALAVMTFMALANPDAVANHTLAEMGGMSLGLGIRLLVCSAVCMVAMMLPGLSGSLLMLLLGIYGVVMEAVATLNFIVLAPVVVGVAAGGIIGVLVLQNLLRFHPQVLYSAILGLMVGSIIVIWPGFSFGLEGILAIAGLIVFGLAAYFLASKK